ncbi:MAG: folylpolyglutamate synthase/dihydrofolate synthase family protein [Chloroherpetonaceae bacterium]|nr:folylpolyglutamate synthase/dihydrofolate synthase family protein [Chloroherpetonaceae bacterium]
MTYQEAIDFLYPLHRFGMKMNLENITALSKFLGQPERQLGTVVHIAGTNGKGSTAAFVASICQEAGLKTALYTSPHVEHLTERIRINGKMIPAERLAEYTAHLRAKIEELGATFFEAMTAMAFRYFADEQVDVSVVEVGMGGRLDATNIVSPSYCLITPIDFDHQEWLGNTIAQIATEKAGIIKKGAKTLVARQHLDAMEVLVATARMCQSPITVAPAVSRLEYAASTLGELGVHLWTPVRNYFGLRTPLWGNYQAENLRLAVLCAESMGIAERPIRNGVRNVLYNTGHRARLEIVSRSPLIILDVAHNPDGMMKTVQALEQHRTAFGHLHIVFGAMRDKDINGMVAALKRIGYKFYLASPANSRAAHVEELAKIFYADTLPF